MISKFEIIKRLFTSVLAVLQPFIIYFSFGELQSISPVLLLLLTVFSVQDWVVLHNVFAITFFIISSFPLWSIKKFRFYLPIYLFSIFFLFFGGFFWMETWGIITLVFYHMHVMFYSYYLKH